MAVFQDTDGDATVDAGELVILPVVPLIPLLSQVTSSSKLKTALYALAYERGLLRGSCWLGSSTVI